MLDLSLNTPDEIIKKLGSRLRTERLALGMSQADVASRAGVGGNTVSSMEAGRNVSFESLVRVAMVLGRGKELEGLFQPKLDTLDDILRYEKSAKRHRIKRKSDDA